MIRNLLAVLRQIKWVIDGPYGAAQAVGLHPDPLRSRLKKPGITRSSQKDVARRRSLFSIDHR
jgi:hypothetical protein